MSDIRNDVSRAATDARNAVTEEAASVWATLSRWFNRFWPIAAAAAGGYVLGTMHALGHVL